MGTLEFDLAGFEEVGQEHQGKESVAQESEGGKEAKVAEEVAVCEQEAQESAYSGDAAQNDGGALISQEFLDVSYVVEVDEYVQAVADGNAQDDGAKAQGHEGHVAFDPVHAGHGEEGAVDDREYLVQDEADVMEAEHHDNEDEEQGQANGPYEVPLDGAGVGNAALRVAVNQDAKVRMCGFKVLAGFVDHLDKAGAFTGVGRDERGGQEGQGYALVQAKEMAVNNVEAAGHALRKGLEENISKAQRVHGYQLGVVAGFIFHDKVGVFYHLGLNGFLGERFFNEGVPGGIQERRKVGQAVFHGAETCFDIQSGEDATDEVAGRVPLLKHVAELIYALSKDEGVDRVQGVP